LSQPVPARLIVSEGLSRAPDHGDRFATLATGISPPSLQVMLSKEAGALQRA
jgi:hypothetical protein